MLFYMSLKYIILFFCVSLLPIDIFLWLCRDFYCHHVSGGERDKINLVLRRYILWENERHSVFSKLIYVQTSFSLISRNFFVYLYLRISSWRKMEKVLGCCRVQYGPSRLVCFLISPRNFLLICNSHLASDYRYCW